MFVYDAIIIGAGAAGLFCALTAARLGKTILVLEGQERAGKKILISGGGRCNFTNTGANPSNYISSNPHFCKSALSRFTPSDFVSLVRERGIPFHEKKLGQLFCDRSSKDLLNWLLEACRNEGVTLQCNASIGSIQKNDALFCVTNRQNELHSQSLIIASGALSFKALGATPIGYEIAEQFGMRVIQPKPGLVPLSGDSTFVSTYGPLSGMSFTATVSTGKISFTEDVLITHDGLSGPAILQISSYWKPGDKVIFDIGPGLSEHVRKWHTSNSDVHLHNFLSQHLPRRFVETWMKDQSIAAEPAKRFNLKDVSDVTRKLSQWELTPRGTAGYTKAEVTVGGVDTDELSSKTMESRKVPGLYFIGEVVDVTGWLGGYNFQWAWASAHAAAEALATH